MNLCDVSGVGSKTLELLHKLKITSIDDLINYYPYRYNVLKKNNASVFMDKEDVVIDGVVECKGSVMYLSKGLKIFSFRINTGCNIFNICVFNKTYLAKDIYAGVMVTIIGKYNKLRNAIVASEVRLGLMTNEIEIEPVYYLTHGLSKKKLSKIISNVINSEVCIKDNIPDYLVVKYNFMNKHDAILQIHNPSDIFSLKKARLRLKYEELFVYMSKIIYMKKRNKVTDRSISRVIDRKKIEDFVLKLPFSLTEDQMTVIEEIFKDMENNVRMNRLLQGDVGSGKTIVAFISCYANFLSSYQSALMVPTEILAKQHYEKARELFDNYGLKVELLTASVKKNDYDRIICGLESGEVDLVIGTQSLIQERVNYHNLGLVVTDEQHRFGVNQRTTFRNKGDMCDVLCMSATPIPRTYALTIYGDLDVSSIKSKPNCRMDVITKIILEKNIIEGLKIMYNELSLGHQVYVIAPLISSTDDDGDKESVETLSDKMNKAFGRKFLIGVIHGRLSNASKEEIMNKYVNKEIDILISTTVIEVGIDVKNATVMMIFNANMFGLSTLHQLRGRVGRSDLQSYCFLVTKDRCERLNILEHTNDGFEVANYDFENRGEGDLFGFRQSGERHFLLADLRKDYNILLRVKDDVYDFFENNTTSLLDNNAVCNLD